MEKKDKKKIAILETGGTINGMLEPGCFFSQGSAVIEHLERHASDLNIEIGYVKEICMKDSRDITLKDRENIVLAIRSLSESFILIPHGTFTMIDTAMYLKQNLSQLLELKTVILIGSMQPLLSDGSDAKQNLEFAIKSFSVLAPGIWIAMHEKIWEPERVKKNLKTGNFEYMLD